MKQTQIKKFLKEESETSELGEWKLGIPTIACFQISDSQIEIGRAHV